MPSKTSNLLSDFGALTARSELLSTEEAQRLELLRDVLGELGALPQVPGGTRVEADPVRLPQVGARPLILVKLSDAGQQARVVEALVQAGIEAEVSTDAVHAAVITIVDPGTALEFADAQLVMMNVSGPDALVGKLAKLRLSGFIKRGAPVAAVLEAVSLLLIPQAST